MDWGPAPYVSYGALPTQSIVASPPLHVERRSDAARSYSLISQKTHLKASTRRSHSTTEIQARTSVANLLLARDRMVSSSDCGMSLAPPSPTSASDGLLISPQLPFLRATLQPPDAQIDAHLFSSLIEATLSRRDNDERSVSSPRRMHRHLLT